MTEGEGERLQKVLARAGVGSRRACEDMIRAGRVTVNGRTAELGMRVGEQDTVLVDGIDVGLGADLVYRVLHKPTGVLTAMRDARGRRTVADLVPAEPRVFPVGRLDLDTSGLLLLTNDGGLANRIAHPRYEVPKTYVAEVRPADAASVGRLRRGVELPDGPARPEKVRLRATSAGKGVVEIVVREGRNRLVRRMLDAVGMEVISLVRTAIGPLRLGRLRPGEWRDLMHEEIAALERAARS